MGESTEEERKLAIRFLRKMADQLEKGVPVKELKADVEAEANDIVMNKRLNLTRKRFTGWQTINLDMRFKPELNWLSGYGDDLHSKEDE